MTQGMLMFYGGIVGLIFSMILHIIIFRGMKKEGRKVKERIEQQYS